MPKIIEHAKERLLEEAREMLFSQGYRRLNIRDVAKRCRMATGTVYNYFPSKEVLTAQIILEDWTKALSQMRRAAQAGDRMAGLRGVYQELAAFQEKYRPIFGESESAAVFSHYAQWHARLREQVAQALDATGERAIPEPERTAAAQLYLTGTTEGWDFPVQEKLIKKFLQEKGE